jgi:excisionase family DNA binding protein
MNKRPKPEPRAVSSTEAAAMLSISKRTMDKLIREKKVESFKIGRVYRITTASIDQLIKQEEVGGS